MTIEETTQLLGLVKWCYPASYTRMTEQDAKATIRIWHKAFEPVPYEIMEQALWGHVMRSRYAPVVAEMVEQLSVIYYQYAERHYLGTYTGKVDYCRECEAVMAVTKQYAEGMPACCMLAMSLGESKSNEE